MDVTGDLANKVLTAEVRNIITDVGQGGKMTAAQRDIIAGFAITPDSAREARVKSLIQKWSDGGELTVAQWSEVHAAFPEFKSANPSAPAPLESPEASPPAHRRKTSKADIARWFSLYGKKERQLFRYVAEGEKHHDPCPLDSPTEFLHWWARRMKHRAPTWLLDAAQKSPAPTAPSDASPTAVAPAPAPNTPGFKGESLTEYDLAEGEAVQQQRALVKLAFEQLQRAYQREGSTDIDALHRKHERAMIALGKVEAAELDRKKRLGLYLLKSEVEHDIARACELLRQMRQAMARRVIELCDWLDGDQRILLTSSIEKVRIQEEKTLSRLGTSDTPDDLAQLLL